MVFRLACGTLAFLATAHAYVWPSPQLDALEAVRFDQLGFNMLTATLATFVQPCNLFLFDPTIGPNSGRSDAADWIRTVGFSLACFILTPDFMQAYHDAATHNSTDGTGGMDGSIRLPAEQARAEVCWTDATLGRLALTTPECRQRFRQHYGRRVSSSRPLCF
jgi:hypothetical protein